MVGVVRIVVVDPSRLVLKSISRMLAAGNHEARPFVDGREALAHIKADPDVDVLITSTEPESIPGVELCWETRLLASRDRPIHIILMSSNYDQSHMIEALDSGADDFIGKPPPHAADAIAHIAGGHVRVDAKTEADRDPARLRTACRFQDVDALDASDRAF